MMILILDYLQKKDPIRNSLHENIFLFNKMYFISSNASQSLNYSLIKKVNIVTICPTSQFFHLLPKNVLLLEFT